MSRGHNRTGLLAGQDAPAGAAASSRRLGDTVYGQDRPSRHYGCGDNSTRADVPYRWQHVNSGRSFVFSWGPSCRGSRGGRGRQVHLGNRVERAGIEQDEVARVRGGNGGRSP